MSNTPETDAAWQADKNIVFRVETSRKLERERNEAMEKLDEEMKWHHRTHTELVQTQCKILDIQMSRDKIQEKYDNLTTEHMLVINKLFEERDKAKEDAAHWKTEWKIVEARLCGWKHPCDNGIIFEHEVIPKLQQQLKEAQEELNDIRLNLGKDADGYTLIHAVCVLQNERDELLAKLSTSQTQTKKNQ